MRRLRLLVVEDDEVFVKAMGAFLRTSYGDGLEVRWVDELEAALTEIARDPPDAVVLDLTLPDSAGLDTLRRVRRASPETPIVVLTSNDDETTGPRALAEGAQDFLVKGDFGLPVLPRTVRHAIERKRLETQP